MIAESSEGLALSLGLSVICLFLYGWFSAAQSAFNHANERQLRRLAHQNHKAQKAVRHLEQQPRLWATLSWVKLLAALFPAAGLTWSLAPPLGRALSFLPLPPADRQGIAAGLIVLGQGVVFLLVGSLIPRKIAAARPEVSALRTAGLVNWFAVLARPVTWSASLLANGTVRAMGMNPHASDDPATEEEIRMMVDESGQSGSIDAAEQDMIANIFEFNDTVAREIMTHRTDLIAVEDTDSVQAVVELAVREGYSRIPVYHEDLDDMLGIVYVKDLLRYVGRPISRNLRASTVMRPAFFVPDSLPASELFQQMTARRVQAAILVDEYGGTRGMVTMEDILESIVGNIQDEYDHEEEAIRAINDHTFLVDGSAPADEVSRRLGVALPQGDYDTIAGLVTQALGSIPREEECPSVTVGNLTLTVEQVEESRITRLLVEKHES